MKFSSFVKGMLVGLGVGTYLPQKVEKKREKKLLTN